MKKLTIGVMMLIAGLMIGYSISEICYKTKLDNTIKIYEEKRKVDGFWFKAEESEVKNLSIEKDSQGDWVCVNIKGMSYERGLEVCNHEVGHEIFAEISEKHPDKIKEIMKGLEDGQ